MNVSQSIVQFVNAILILLPIVSLHLHRTQRYKSDRYLILESVALFMAFFLYLIQAILTRNNYNSIYFTVQLVVSAMTIMSIYSDSDSPHALSSKLSPFDRGVLLHHDTSLSYNSTSSETIPRVKKQSQQLNFFIEEEEEDAYSVDVDEYFNETPPAGNRNHFKLKAPVLATLLALSPVHTEAIPIRHHQAPPPPGVAAPIPIANTVLPIAAFILILLSKNIGIMHKINARELTALNVPKVASLQFLAVLSIAVMDPCNTGSFVLEYGGYKVLLYLLLFLDSLSLAASALLQQRAAVSLPT